MVPIVIVCMEEGIKKVKGQKRKVLNDDKTVTAVAQEILRAVLNESETIMHKAMSGLIQG